MNPIEAGIRPGKPEFVEPRLPVLFSVHSWGNAFSHWVAKLLASHPDVLTVTNLRAFIPQRLAAEQYFDVLAGIGSYYLAMGDVHGTGPHEYSQLSARYGTKFRGAGLVGHPIVRLASSVFFHNSAGRTQSYKDFLTDWNLSADQKFAAEALNILGPTGNYIPAKYLMLTNGVAEQLKVGPLYKVEHLSVDYAYWNEFFQYVTTIESSFSESSFRYHQQFCYGVAQWEFHRGGPAATWELLSSERQALVKNLFSPEARKIYQGFGYDLSVLDQ